VKLTTHLHLVPRSKNDGAIPPLLQYAFMVWCLVKSTGTTLPLPFTFIDPNLIYTSNVTRFTVLHTFDKALSNKPISINVYSDIKVY
jgi:hypothetical protein